MQGLKTPNGYQKLGMADGAAEANIAVPANTNRIELYGRGLDIIVGLSKDTSNMFDSSPETKETTVLIAGNGDPVAWGVNPTPSGGDRLGYLHYKPLQTGSTSTLYVLFYR